MAIASVVFDPTDGSVAESKADSAGVVASTADSKADSAGVIGSTADSKAVVGESKADSAGDAASTADSKAVVADDVADTASTNVASAIGSEPEAGGFKVTDIDRNSDGEIVIEYDDSAIDS